MPSFGNWESEVGITLVVKIIHKYTTLPVSGFWVLGSSYCGKLVSGVRKTRGMAQKLSPALPPTPNSLWVIPGIFAQVIARYYTAFSTGKTSSASLLFATLSPFSTNPIISDYEVYKRQ